MTYLWYEDIIKDMPGTIEKIAKNLNVKLTDDQISALAEHMKFDNFKTNKAVNNEDANNKEKGISFIRKGVVGDWKNNFSEQKNEEFESWIQSQKEKFGITDLEFKEK